MPSNSLKAKILLLGLVSILTVGAISLIAFFTLSGKVDSYKKLIELDVAAVSTVDETTALFKKQVQEWKNVLLRGHNEKDLNKYWERFKDNQKEIQKRSSTLLALDIPATAKTHVRNFKEEHERIFSKYQEGYNLFINNSFDSRMGDQHVRGIDREPTKELEKASKIIVETVKSEAASLSASSNTIVTVGVSVIVLAVLAAGFFSFYLSSQKIAKPIENIINNVRRLAEGDFNFRLRVNNRDELGEIADSIRSLQEKLVSSTDDINVSMDVLRRTDETLSNISSSIQSGTENQYSRTDQVASAMNQMSSTSREVAQHAAEAADASKDAEDAADSGENVMESAISTISKMRDHISSTTEVITTLETNTTEVGTVLDVIRGIAEQTNLLALNAAIEAARAGEQGRGFAVVADEVRSLAQRTQESTAEIHEIIESVQGAAQNAVKAIETGRDQSEESMNKVNEAGDQLKIIKDSVDKITNVNQFIASAAHEQAAVAEDITKNISEIADIASVTANQAKEVIDSAQQMRDTRIGLEKVITSLRST